MTIALKGLVGLIGLLLGVLGARWMFAPGTVAEGLGITLGDLAALNTARGDLGGMFIAACILCAIGLRTGDGRWLQAVAVVIGCVAVGRSVGLAADGVAGSSLAAIAVELTMVAVLLLTAARSDAAAG